MLLGSASNGHILPLLPNNPQSKKGFMLIALNVQNSPACWK